ncbi:MAG TPA: hypothetical protein VFY92_04065, partial [Hyphomicrobiaceae bacterium]|nr:hypothetical protein [Hyphomicrobiaceae bacterium]
PPHSRPALSARPGCAAPDGDAARAVTPKHMRSGMTEVSAAITKLMCTSGIASLLRQIAVCLAELVRSADVADRAELASINALIAARRQESTALRNRVEEEERSLGAFEDHAHALRASFEEVEVHFREVVETGSRGLRDRLFAQVRDFAVKEADALQQTLQESPGRWTWRCDVMPLRDELEAIYLASFRQAASDIERIEQFLYPQLRIIVSSLLPSYHATMLDVPAWPEGFTPSVAPLGDKVAVDLDVAWWRRWFAGRRVAKERANHLRSLIEEDFLAISEELVQEAEAHLTQRIDYIMERVNAISSGLHAGVERRAEALARERALLVGAEDGSGLERFEAEQQERANACAARQAAFAAVLTELDAVLGGLDGMHGESWSQ